MMSMDGVMLALAFVMGALSGSIGALMAVGLGMMAGRHVPSLTADEAALYSRLADIERERAEQRLKEAG